MEFKQFKELLQKSFKTKSMGENHIFQTNTDKDEIRNIYLESFPPGTNEIFRERREFDCSACLHFIKAFGNVVFIKQNKLVSIWDFEVDDPKYQAVINNLAEYVKSKPVIDVFVSRERKIGVDKNFEKLENGQVTEWHHLFIELPEKYTNKKDSIETIKSKYRSAKDVFKRSLDEISQESIEVVLELISQNSLYKGEEWKSDLEKFLECKKNYLKVPEEDRENYVWKESTLVSVAISKIRNHSMGTLLIDISENMDLDIAVKRYEKIVAPTNYKRPKPVFSKRMLEKAKETVSELGYMDSLKRRHATLDDITINNLLFTNRDAAKRIEGDVFAEMEEEIAIDSRKFSKIEEIPVEAFVKEILPKAKEVKVFFENSKENNLVSLIAPVNKDAPTMFKWDNAFSWAYSGNIADSDIKDNVKRAGGNVEGVLRFSIQWNDRGEYDQNDLDAHCVEPGGNHIYFSNMRNPRTKGYLDIDIVDPSRGVPAVENIAWADKSKMEHGVYKFCVHNFSFRGGKQGFKAEIEFGGQIYRFDYNKPLKHKEFVPVAEVTFNQNGFTIKELIPSTLSSREMWGINTQQFVPVSTIMYSPNYWDKQFGVGNKHYFFMLKGCVNSEKPNGFYNEFLKQELVEHKRVFEALGSKMAVTNAEDQLSGLGFSSTKRDELIVKVIGQTERVIKVRF